MTVTGIFRPCSSKMLVIPIFFPISPDMASSNFNFYIYTTGELKLHEGVNRLGACAVYIDTALVRAKLELLTGFLVYVRRPQYRKDLLLRRKRDRTAYH